MLDPIVQAAFVGVLVVLLKAVFAALGVEVDEALLNTLALAIVGWLVGLAAMRGVRRAVLGDKPSALEKSSLWHGD
jgi:uncharacterized membrane protein